MSHLLNIETVFVDSTKPGDQSLYLVITDSYAEGPCFSALSCFYVEDMSCFVYIVACWIMFTITIKEFKMQRNNITSCLVLDIFIHLSLQDSHNILFTLRQRKRQKRQC